MVSDVVIVGGGMVGSLFALVLARKGFNVTLVERHAPEKSGKIPSLTARVSAINPASQRILENLGVLEACDAAAISPLQGLKVWDALGGGHVCFDGADVGLPGLGCIIANGALIDAIHGKLTTTAVQLCRGDVPVHIERGASGVALTLNSGQVIHARLAVAADGANSWLREQTAISVKQRACHQQALIALVKTEKPHQQIGRQVFLPTGPLALLPLADPHCCAIVWSSADERANALMEMDAAAFECELNNAFGESLGMLHCVGGRTVFPLIMRHALRYSDSRVVLIGDAAHTIHPLAGQGVNLGFLDAAALHDCLVDARDNRQDIGMTKPLRRYERWRKGHNGEMIAAMRVFYELFGNTNPLTVQMRSQGLQMVDRLQWVKSRFVNIAVGNYGDLPTLARVIRSEPFN